ncbi:MAG: PLDc N-terminal domain-containing protein, partial [Cellulomonas sp.]|nr:PLDc N-terminal domain-containing protein [Cellulomonas sp.]
MLGWSSRGWSAIGSYPSCSAVGNSSGELRGTPAEPAAITSGPPRGSEHPSRLARRARRTARRARRTVRRSPAATQSWLLLFFVAPWLGLVLYLAIGRPFHPRWRRERVAQLWPIIDRVREHVYQPPTRRPVRQSIIWARRASTSRTVSPISPSSWPTCSPSWRTHASTSWWIVNARPSAVCIIRCQSSGRMACRIDTLALRCNA